MKSILGAAGFTDVSFQSLHEPISFGPDQDDAFDFVSGLTGWMREGLDDEARESALATLRTTIAEHTGDHGVTYQSATWIIQAGSALIFPQPDGLAKFPRGAHCNREPHPTVATLSE